MCFLIIRTVRSGILFSIFLQKIFINFAYSLPLVDQSCEFQSHEKHIYPVGSKWEVRVGSYKEYQCMNCTCLPGFTVRCIPSKTSCESLENCLQIEDVRDSCCPKCIETRNTPQSADTTKPQAAALRKVTECTHDGQTYTDGERWFPEANTTAVRAHHSNQCVQCDCQKTQTICYLKACPVLVCNGMGVTTQSDSCCTICQEMLPPLNLRQFPMTEIHDDLGNGVVEEDFDPYMEAADEEQVAECISGPEKYEDGAQWHPIIPPFGRIKCVICECDAGNIRCKRLGCSDVACVHAVMKPGQCCPVCQDNNEIANVSGIGSYLCMRQGDYLVYENLHGGTVELVLRLPEEEMLWIHSWKMTNDNAEVTSNELKLWEFRNSRAVNDYRLLGTARPKRVSRFARRINKIRHTCQQRCSKRIERLIQVLRVQAASAGKKSNCPNKFRPIDTML